MHYFSRGIDTCRVKWNTWPPKIIHNHGPCKENEGWATIKTNGCLSDLFSLIFVWFWCRTWSALTLIHHKNINRAISNHSCYTKSLMMTTSLHAGEAQGFGCISAMSENDSCSLMLTAQGSAALARPPQAAKPLLFSYPAVGDHGMKGLIYRNLLQETWKGSLRLIVRM